MAKLKKHFVKAFIKKIRNYNKKYSLLEAYTLIYF